MHAYSPLSEFETLIEDMLRTINAEKVMVAGSAEDLQNISPVDAYVIHGDANYYTVMNKLRRILDHAETVGSEFPLVLCLHTTWPFARRDHYQTPETIPDEFRHHHTHTLGVRMGHVLADAGGFKTVRGAFATREGGKHNGVLTALEDFMQDVPDLSLSIIPRNYGLGVLSTKTMARRIWPCIASELNDPTIARNEVKRLRQLYQPRHFQPVTNVVSYQAFKTA